MELELLRQQYNLKMGNIRRWFEEDETFSDWTGKQNFGGGFWVHFFCYPIMFGYQQSPSFP
jgi:hypothetical protein